MKQKLTWLQRGTLQAIIALLIYLLCILAGAYFLDLLEKARFLAVFEKAAQEGAIASANLAKARELIKGMEFADVFVIVWVVFVISVAVFFIIRFSTRINLAKSIILPEAIEFATAMRRLGVLQLAGQIQFIRQHKMPVYIAANPLLGEQASQVKVKHYYFAGHRSLASPAIYANKIGQRLLCLAQADYEQLLQNNTLQATQALTEKNVQIKNLQTELAKLVIELDALTEQKNEINKQLTTALARGQKEVIANERNLPFWLVAIPLIHRLKNSAKPDQKYRRPDIQAEFMKELEKHQSCKNGLINLLKEGYDLDGWPMELIRTALGDLVDKNRGRPSR